MPVRARGAHEARRSRRACPAPARPRCGRRARCRSPTGCRDRSGPGSSVLFGPLRKAWPIGWIGGRYSTSKPIAAMSGSRRAASANVAVDVRRRALRAREELVPGAVARRLAIDDRPPARARRRVARERSGARAISSASASPSMISARASSSSASASSWARVASSRVRSAAPRARRAASSSARPSISFERDRLAGLALERDVVMPRAERVGPALRACTRSACCARATNVAAPAVVVDELHRRLAPRVAPRSRYFEHGRERVVALAEDVGLDLEALADDAFDRVAPAVDLGPHRLDDDGRARRAGRRPSAARSASCAARSPSALAPIVAKMRICQRAAARPAPSASERPRGAPGVDVDAACRAAERCAPDSSRRRSARASRRRRG